MKFKEVQVFSSKEHPTTPLVFYRDPEDLYIWFPPGDHNVYILLSKGWSLWPKGWAIWQVIASDEFFHHG
jgi:hypothetical protein